MSSGHVVVVVVLDEIWPLLKLVVKGARDVYPPHSFLAC